MGVIRVSFHGRAEDVYCEFFWGLLRTARDFPDALRTRTFGRWPRDFPVAGSIDFAEGVVGQA